MKFIKKSIAALLCMVLLISMMPAHSGAKAGKMKLSPAKVTVYVGDTHRIKVKRANKKTKVKWKTSKKSVVKIVKKKSKGKKASAKIYGVSAGKAKITAVYKIGNKKKKIKCRVTVKEKLSDNNDNNTVWSPDNTPDAVSGPVISEKPKDSDGEQTVTEAPNGSVEPAATKEPDAAVTTEPPETETTENPTVSPTKPVTKAPEPTPTKAPESTQTKAPDITKTDAPDKTPAPSPGTYTAELELSGTTALYNEGKVNVNQDGSVTGTNVKGLLIPLGTGVNSGESVKITVYGETSVGMRIWLSDGNAKRWSEIENPMVFGQTYTLTADDNISNESAGSGAFSADYFQIKGASYDSQFTSITIKKVVIEKKYSEPAPTAEPGWVTTWGTAEEKCDITSDAMPKMTLNGSTVRQIIKVTTSGQKIRLRLSNQYGGSDVQIKSLHIAKQVEADKSDIDTSTDAVVTVDGKEEFTIPKGKVIITDAVSFNVNALENIAISAYFGQTPSNNITGHRGARATTYQVSGNHVSDKTLTSYQTTTSWFFLADVSLWTPEGGRAVVCFGDSITDGYGTDAGYLGRKPDSYTRWGDYFAKRLQANQKTKNVAVINEGIGSNSMLGSYPTDAGKDRFARDLLQHDSVAYCIILFGVNDLDRLMNTSKYNQLLPEYQKMVKLCHDNGIKVYGAPILPFGTSSYYSEASEQVRTMINNWMRSPDSQMDGIIDFESAVADPSNPKNVLEKYTHGDGLHPYDGYDVMADAIDLKMFE